MNTKTAKRLRNESRYHPNLPREYHVVKRSNKKGKIGTIELIDSDPRVLYKELKKEHKLNKGAF